jgi:hypothetical protein
MSGNHHSIARNLWKLGALEENHWREIPICVKIPVEDADIDSRFSSAATAHGTSRNGGKI